jgi:polysaccharide biosynthesis/export protein
MKRSFHRYLSNILLFLLFSGVVRGSLPAQAGVGPEVQATPYRLHTGDTISVFYRLTPEYNQSLTILPDGSVSLRVLGRIQVAGLQVEEAQLVIEEEARRRLKNPQVSVSVTDFVREQFTVMGEVPRPGRYELHGETNIADALSLAGGFTQLSAQKKVVLVRPLSSTSEYGNATTFNFKQLTSLGKRTSLPVLKSGDLVVVTTSKFAKATAVVRLVNFGLYYNPLPTP